MALTLRLSPLGPTATHEKRGCWYAAGAACVVRPGAHSSHLAASYLRRFSVLRSAIGDCTARGARLEARTRPCHCQAPQAGGLGLALLNGSRLLREGRQRERRNASFPRPLGRRPAVAAVVSLPSVLANGGALANDTGVALLATRAHAAPAAIRAHRRLAAVDTLLGHVATVLFGWGRIGVGWGEVECEAIMPNRYEIAWVYGCTVTIHRLTDSLTH